MSMKDRVDIELGTGFFGPSMEGKKIGEVPILRKFVEEALTRKEEEEQRARYKIEVAFSWDRTERGPALALITIWESGRQLHGGGDDKMFWCGYADCGKPMTSDTMMIDVGVCPHCNRPLFRSIEDRNTTIEEAKSIGIAYDEMGGRPCISELKFAKLAPRKLAGLLEKIWRDLDCNADIYVKFFRKKICFEAGDRNFRDTLANARMNRSYVVYTLKALLKDTVDGSSVQNRIEAFLTA